MWRKRSLAETIGVELISWNRSFATALQVHHFPIAKTPKLAFAADNLFFESSGRKCSVSRRIRTTGNGKINLKTAVAFLKCA
jgi:hypothetical protein